jgi:hypothetical protein
MSDGDKTAPPRRPVSGIWGACLGGTLGACLVGVAYATFGEEFVELARALPGWAFAPLLVTGLLAALAGHELGHVLGGALVGFRFSLLAVGPLRIEREGRLRVRFNSDLTTWGGIALSLPTDERDLHWRSAVMVAGGPVFSGILGLAGLAVFAWMSASGQWSAGLRLLAMTLGGTSLGLMVVTLIPMPMGLMLSDGGRLVRLLRGGPRAERDVAIMGVVGCVRVGRGPDAWSPGQIERLTRPHDGSTSEWIGRTLAFTHAMAMGDRVGAEEHARRLVEFRPVIAWATRLAMDVELAAYFVEGGDRELAAAIIADCERHQGVLPPEQRATLEQVRVRLGRAAS